MEKSLYEIMQEILAEKKTDFTKDLEYLGTITSDEQSPTGSVQVTRDIFMMTDDMPDGSVVQKFYDSDKNFIGGRDKDGKVYPSAEFASDDLSFLGQLEDLSMEKGISFNEMDNKLEIAAKALGISKEEILAMSETDLEQKISERENGEAQITLGDDEQSEEQNEGNAAALDSIASKQEIKLNQKVDDKHTLAEVMGVPAGSKLVTVYSDSIANNKNTTRFSHLILTPDGNVQEADMLKQVGGKNSDKTIYESNRDGSQIEKMQVQSTYEIDSPVADHVLITAKIGSMGYIEVGYGQMDRTSHREAFTHELETERTRYTTAEVRQEFSEKNGIDNVTEKVDEIQRYEKYGCKDDLTLEQADGNPSTGVHMHEETLEEIKSYDSNIGEVFTDGEITERFQKMAAEYPDDSIEEVVERTKRDLSADADRIHQR